MDADWIIRRMKGLRVVGDAGMVALPQPGPQGSADAGAGVGSGLRGPGVAQGYAAGEDRRPGAVVAAVGDEVAAAFELPGILRRGFGRRGLDVSAPGRPRVRHDDGGH